MRKPTESATKVSARVLLVPTRIMFPKRQQSRKAAHYARSMGARTRLIILVSAVSMIKMELYKRVSAEKQPLDRSAMAAVRLLVPSCRSCNASRNLRRRSKRPRKVRKRRSIAKKTATLVIPTWNRIVGTVVLEDPVATKNLN